MAVTTAVLSGTVTDITGALTSAYLKRVVVVIEANTDGSLLLDTDGNRIMAGPKRVAVDTSTGAYSVTLPKTDSADILPASPGRLFRVRLIYPSGIPGAGNISQTSGWWELTADGSLSDADKWPGLEVTSVSDELLDTIAQNADDAEAAAAAAEAAQAAVEAVVATTDGLMTAVDANDASDFRVQQDARQSAIFVPRGRQLIDVRDWGVIGDGASHPLSDTYASLAAAQVDFPMAQALTDETDAAAALSLAYARPGERFLVSALTDMVTNLPIDLVGRGTKWKVDGSIQNTAARNTPSAYMDKAYVFRAGNMHPVILKAASGYTWPTVALNAISAGQKSVTVTTPGDVATAGVTLTAGDFVMIRNNSGEVATGAGSIWDYQQFNKVVSWNSGTGVLVLEKPIKISISSGAKLCINDGNIDTTTSVDQPWWMADEVEVECSGYLSGLSPFSGKMGAWKSQLYVARGDFQDALSSQAFVNSHIEIGASTFTGRLAEIKFAAQDSSVKIRGDYVYSSDVASPSTTASIGEQSHKIDLDMTLMRGGDFPSNVLALDIWAQNITVRGRIDDYANQGQQHVVQVRSVDHATRPPADIDCNGLVVRTITGRTRYALVGTDGLLAAPKRIQMGLNVGTIDSGAVPSYLCQVGVGTEVDVAGSIGDVRRVNATGAGEVPENGPYLFAQLTGSTTATATASTDNINMASHGLGVGQAIRFTSLTGGVGLSTGTTYYIVAKTTTTFQVSLTDGGSVVDITTNYTNVQYALSFPPGQHFYGDFTITGPKAGDQVIPFIQAIQSTATGEVGDLTLKISRTSSGLYRIRITNESTTEITYSSNAAPIAIAAHWSRNRN